MKNQFKSDIIKSNRKAGGFYKEIYYMRKLWLALLTLSMVFSVAGCGQEQTVSEAGVTVEKDGTITSVLTDSFEKDFYDLEDLRDMIRLEASAYNQEKGGERIGLESLEMNGSNCVAVMKYQSFEDYAEYNEVPFFAGTVKEAEAAGIDTAVTWLQAGSGTVTEWKEIETAQDYRLVVWYGDMPVAAPGKIRYYSDNLTLVGAKKAEPEQSDPAAQETAGPFYVLYK